MIQDISISVIIPAYNAAVSIIDALESVRTQSSMPDYEIIVVDDGSHDSTQEVVTNYFSEHPEVYGVLVAQENKGVAAARNAGMRKASKKWIAFLDSDDRWMPTKIEEQIACIEDNPEIDFIGTDKIGSPLSIWGRKKKGLSRISIKEQFIKWYPLTPTYMFKTEILEKIGLMDETLRYGEDNDFLIRILHSCSAWFLARPLLEVDKNRRIYEHSGLSSNLKVMQAGQREVIRRARECRMLSFVEYVFARTFAEIKYVRRCVKMWLLKRNNS